MTPRPGTSPLPAGADLVDAPGGAITERPLGDPASTKGLAEEARVRRVELVISLVLRVGVVVSLLVVVSGVVEGMVVHPAQRSSPALEHRLLTGLAHYPHSFGALFTGLGHGDPTALVAAGLLLLVVTPVLRVTVSIFTFVYQRDPRFVVVTSFVLAVLIGSCFLGKAGG